MSIVFNGGRGILTPGLSTTNLNADTYTGNISNALVTATGTLSARSLQDRFADVVNVKDFGAVGNGVADDTAAIQAAIDANPGKTIYLPNGFYKISSTIRIKRFRTSLIGETQGSAWLNVSFNSIDPAILVESDLTPTQPVIYGACIKNITIQKIVANTVASVGVEFRFSQNIQFTDSVVSGFATGIKLKGGINNLFSNLVINSYNPVPSTFPSGTSLIEINKADGTGSTWTPSTLYTAGASYVVYNSTTYVCTVTHTSTLSFDDTKWQRLTGYTQLFDNCIIGANSEVSYCVSILSNDYCIFSSCYLASATIAIVRIDSSGDFNADNWFDHCYFDGVRFSGSDPNGSPLGVWIKENNGPNVAQNFTDCAFGQMGNAIYIDEEAVTQVGVTDCRFAYIYEQGIFISSNSVDFRLVGCAFENSCTELPDRSIIKIDDAKSVTIAGNIFNFNAVSYPANTTSIYLSPTASIDCLSITGNVFNSNSVNVTDYNNFGATINSLTITGNASNNNTNTIVGHVIGNTANSNTRSLDWYEEGTWTPTLLFGGSSTGITYSAGQRVGSYTRVGDRVSFDCYFLLSNKGSSTGTVTISGLPYDQSGTYPSTYSLEAGSLAPGLSGMLSTRRESAREFSLRFLIPSTGVLRYVTSSDFTNNTFLVVSGNYKV